MPIHSCRLATSPKKVRQTNSIFAACPRLSQISVRPAALHSHRPCQCSTAERAKVHLCELHFYLHRIFIASPLLERLMAFHACPTLPLLRQDVRLSRSSRGKRIWAGPGALPRFALTVFWPTARRASEP